MAHSQDAINQAAANAHWRAYQAALKAGKSQAEAMRIANEARQRAGGAL